jgi:hypothetical protein
MLAIGAGGESQRGSKPLRAQMGRESSKRWIDEAQVLFLKLGLNKPI